MENFAEIIQQFMIPTIVIACYIVGEIIKRWIADVDNKFIPTINAILGVLLACWINWNVTPEIVIAGLVSGWASTGAFEAIRNLTSKGE